MIDRMSFDTEHSSNSIIMKLNQVIDAHNALHRLYIDLDKALHSELESVWQCIEVEDVDMSLPENPAKKEEKLYLTAEGMRAYDGSKWA